MAERVTRRQALEIAAVGVGALALGRVPQVGAARRVSTAAEIGAAATSFLGSLGADARRRATYAFGDSERFRWHWTIPESVPRNGLPLRDMTAEQRRRALELLRASSSAVGYRKSLDIVKLQGVLRQEVGVGSSFDPERYYVTVFGTPGGTRPWGWRFEGHHLSRHFTLVGDQVGVYPYFLGAWPTRVTEAYANLPRGYRTMPREEAAARTLVRSLGRRQQRIAIFRQESLTDHVTQNQQRVSPLEPVGVLVGSLTAAQRRLVREIVDTYAAVLPAESAHRGLDRIERAGFERLRLGWAGSLVPNHPHYYRIQGPTFLLEFDNSRNEGTHIHSVWRDFREDFGEHLV
ncbi:MAG TPA: DUF3500 domain-containing protein [Gaiellaceae bacterium]|jgi:hypothetical protein